MALNHYARFARRPNSWGPFQRRSCGPQAQHRTLLFRGCHFANVEWIQKVVLRDGSPNPVGICYPGLNDLKLMDRNIAARFSLGEHQESS